MQGITIPGARTAQSQSPQQTTKPACRQRKAVAAVDVAPSAPPPRPTGELTTEQHRWAVNFFRQYEQIDDDGRDSLMGINNSLLNQLVETQPRKKAPALRLVKGGAK